MPCCLNHKTSLSLGNKAAPEREFQQKFCVPEVLRALQGGGLQQPFPPQPFRGHPWCSLLQQGMVSLSPLGFVHSFVSKWSSQRGIKSQRVGNVGQNGNFKARKGLESL